MLHPNLIRFSTESTYEQGSIRYDFITLYDIFLASPNMVTQLNYNVMLLIYN